MKRTNPPKKKQRISHSSAKAKGKELQRWACRKISELTGYEWGASGEDKPIESRAMGQHGPDVRMESQVRKLFPYSVETKWQETWNVPGWIEQAKENEMEGTNWLLVIKRSRKDPVVVMDADAFFELMKRLDRYSI